MCFHLTEKEKKYRINKKSVTLGECGKIGTLKRLFSKDLICTPGGISAIKGDGSRSSKKNINVRGRKGIDN